MPLHPTDAILKAKLETALARKLSDEEFLRIFKLYAIKQGEPIDKLASAVSDVVLLENFSVRAKLAAADNVNRVVQDVKNKLDQKK